ncbi:MAG: hypothetical protein QOF78_1690 [Phycisphaerales bacterium]|nr:hypothetical protein [Phycisphaerales bacterium]
MHIRSLLIVFPMIALIAASPTTSTTSPSTRPGRPAARGEPLAVLPGKGLAQHDFLYAGEWDTRNPTETIFLVRGGKIVWTHEIPDKDANNVLNEFGDVHMLSNGNVLYTRKTGATEIAPDKKVVWDYDAPAGTEVHTAQPIGLDKVFICQNGTPAKAMLINKKTGNVEMEHELPVKDPTNPKGVHGQFRHIRLLKNGHYLIAALGLGKVIEFDANWREIWSVDAPSAWAAVRLTNGNTLISGNQHGYVREVNPRGEVVWEVTKDELPGYPLYTVQECSRLANGNTIICNWGGSIRKEDWPKVVQVIQVTPLKQVVWALHQWKDPDLGPSSCLQLLDEPGAAENFDHMR